MTHGTLGAGREELGERFLKEMLKRGDGMPGVAHVEVFADRRRVALPHTGHGAKHDVARRRLRRDEFEDAHPVPQDAEDLRPEGVRRSMKTISFAGDGAAALDGLWRAYGSTINLTRITPAAREGYTFTGWYADEACTRPITRLVVTGDMELYAGWEPIPVEEEEEETEAETTAEA